LNLERGRRPRFDVAGCVVSSKHLEPTVITEEKRLERVGDFYPFAFGKRDLDSELVCSPRITSMRDVPDVDSEPFRVLLIKDIEDERVGLLDDSIASARFLYRLENMLKQLFFGELAHGLLV